MNEEHIKKSVKELLIALDQDVNSGSMVDTPNRVAKSYMKQLEGYSRSLDHEMTVFPNADGYDDIIYSGRIKFFSTCEHHLLPFFGFAHVAYVPSDKIAGLSKLSRAVDIFSRRLQQQERITVQVADEISRILDAKGVAVMLEGQHFCNISRGVKQADSTMKTLAFRGAFKDDSSLRDQFMNLAN